MMKCIGVTLASRYEDACCNQQGQHGRRKRSAAGHGAVHQQHSIMQHLILEAKGCSMAHGQLHTLLAPRHILCTHALQPHHKQSPQRLCQQVFVKKSSACVRYQLPDLTFYVSLVFLRWKGLVGCAVRSRRVWSRAAGSCNCPSALRSEALASGCFGCSSGWGQKNELFYCMAWLRTTLQTVQRDLSAAALHQPASRFQKGLLSPFPSLSASQHQAAPLTHCTAEAKVRGEKKVVE